MNEPKQTEKPTSMPAISGYFNQLIQENPFLNNPAIIPNSVCREYIKRGLHERALLLCDTYRVNDEAFISKLWPHAMAFFQQQANDMDFTRSNNVFFDQARECAMNALEKAFLMCLSDQPEAMTDSNKNNQQYLQDLEQLISELDQYCEDFQQTLQEEDQLFFTDPETGKIFMPSYDKDEPENKMLFIRQYNQLQSIRNCLNKPMTNAAENIAQHINHLENNIENAKTEIQSKQAKKLLPSNFLDKLILLICKIASVFSASNPADFVYLQSQLSNEYHSRKKLTEKLQQAPEKLRKSTGIDYTESI